MDTERKRAMEVDVMMEMIALYCHGHSHAHCVQEYPAEGLPALCPDCRRLLRYARERIIRCPRMDVKSFCSACPVHCYSMDMRAHIREVMRYSGLRMLLHRPLMTLHHMWIDFAARRHDKKGTPP